MRAGEVRCNGNREVLAEISLDQFARMRLPCHNRDLANCSLARLVMLSGQIQTAQFRVQVTAPFAVRLSLFEHHRFLLASGMFAETNGA